jgi:hypothetical protein
MQGRDPVTVAFDGSGDFTTLFDALDRPSVAQIEVRPGVYQGGFELPGGVSITGLGAQTDAEIRSKARPCLVSGGAGAISNLTLAAIDCWALEIRSGALRVDDCVLASVGAPSMVVSGSSADPQLTRCSIERDSRALPENEASEEAPTGRVAPTSGGGAGSMKAYYPTGKRPVHPNCAVRLTDGSRGRFVDCDVHVGAAPVGGVFLDAGADPRFEGCRIGNGDSLAVHVSGARGTFDGCTINAQWWTGVAIDSGGDPVFRRCRIIGGCTGVSVFGAKGSFEDCEIAPWTYEDNVPGHGGPQRAGEQLRGPIGIQIAEAGDPTIRNSWVHDRGRHAVVLKKGAAGVIERCRFERSGKRAIKKALRARTKLEANVIG